MLRQAEIQQATSDENLKQKKNTKRGEIPKEKGKLKQSYVVESLKSQEDTGVEEGADKGFDVSKEGRHGKLKTKRCAVTWASTPARKERSVGTGVTTLADQR